MSTRIRTTLIGLAIMMTACSTGDGPVLCIPYCVSLQASAGADQNVVAGDAMILTGSAMWTNSSVSYKWRQLSGPSVTIYGTASH